VGRVRRRRWRCWGGRRGGRRRGSGRRGPGDRAVRTRRHERHGGDPAPGAHGCAPWPADGRARSAFVRPKIATISGPSLDTRSNFHPRFPMSARHEISFSHSLAVVRNTRRSATSSHCGGYGGDGEEEGGGRAISRVLFARPKAGRWSSLWDGCHQPPRRGLPAARTTRAGSRCLFGLAPTGGHRAAPVTRRAVGSYPTVSPLPLDAGRFVFCGPVRRLAAPRRYLAVYPAELGLSSARPNLRRTATITPCRHPAETYRHGEPQGKANAPGGAGAAPGSRYARGRSPRAM